MGNLNWEQGGGREYGSRISPGNLRAAADGLRIIAEGRDDNEATRIADGHYLGVIQGEYQSAFPAQTAYEAENVVSAAPHAVRRR